MFEKLRSLEDKYEELSHLLADPKVMEDQREYQKHAKAHAALEDIVNVYRQYNRVLKEEEDARQLLAEEGNPEFKEMVRQELEELVQKKEKLERFKNPSPSAGSQ